MVNHFVKLVQRALSIVIIIHQVKIQNTNNCSYPAMIKLDKISFIGTVFQTSTEIEYFC